MKTELCTMSDFNEIVSDIVDFWGSDRALHLHHPFLIYEFGNTAFVIKEQGRVLAYLFGFFSQTENLAYIHLLGVREKYRKQGLASVLYETFIEVAKSKGCAKIKAITSASNVQSIAFHKNRIGMTLLGEPNQDGVNVVKDYSGVNIDRVVFEKRIDN